MNVFKFFSGTLIKLSIKTIIKISYLAYRPAAKFLKILIYTGRFFLNILNKMNADSSLFAAVFFGLAIYLYGNKFAPGPK